MSKILSWSHSFFHSPKPRHDSDCRAHNYVYNTLIMSDNVQRSLISCKILRHSLMPAIPSHFYQGSWRCLDVCLEAMSLSLASLQLAVPHGFVQLLGWKLFHSHERVSEILKGASTQISNSTWRSLGSPHSTPRHLQTDDAQSTLLPRMLQEDNSTRTRTSRGTLCSLDAFHVE